jgi:anti-anti-sigma factor
MTMYTHDPSQQNGNSGAATEQVAGRYELGRHTVVWAQGEIDLDTADEFRHVLTEATRRDSPRVIVDLTGVSFMDSTGLQLLIAAQQAAETRGGTVRLVGTRPRVRRVFDITRTDVLFPIHATVADSARADPEAASPP